MPFNLSQEMELVSSYEGTNPGRLRHMISVAHVLTARVVVQVVTESLSN